MVNYNNGKIYKIVCNVTGEIYIGSTCEPTLARRLAGHRGSFKRWKEEKSKKTYKSFEIIERGDYNIVLIENVICENKEQLLRRERHHIETNVCLNKNIPSRTNVEYQEVNNEKINKQRKEYREDNKEKVKEQYKNYYENNKEKMAEKNKKYREANKTKLTEKKKAKREQIKVSF